MGLKRKKQAPQILDNNVQYLLYVPQILVRETAAYFLPYCKARVETACFWFGIETSSCQIVTTLVLPQFTLQTGGNYLVESESSRQIAYDMSEQGLVNLAQIHTHPDNCSTHHSYYDDQHAYSTREHALSLVWPNYGCTANFTLRDVGVHERLKEQWVFLSDLQVAQRIRVVESTADYRWNIPSGEGNEDEREYI